MQDRDASAIRPDAPKQSSSYLVFAILLIHAALLARIAAINAPVSDEIGHLPSGVVHWRYGTYDLYKVNPPLMRMIAAVPLLFANPVIPLDELYDGPYARPEFRFGTAFLRENGFRSFWLFMIGRWAQIPVSMLGGWICYRWATELYGSSSGKIAVTLWCFCPNILTWGATITPDIGAATFGVGAGYTLWRWLRQPSKTAAMLAGLMLGLAELSKSTWIILFLLWPILWLAWRRSKSPSAPIPSSGQLAIVMGLGLYVLNIGYGFEGSCTRLDQFDFISRALGGSDSHQVPGNRFRGTAIGQLRIPLPSNYIKGIDIQKYDFERGKWSYLRGDQKIGGWYHYYVYGIAVKTPEGTLFIVALAAFLFCFRRSYRGSFAQEIILFAPWIAVLVLVSTQTGFNRYLRYILPVLPFLYISASRVGMAFELQHSRVAFACALGLVASISSSLSVYPHSMSYFNLVAGGPTGGPQHLLDANIDWGQDLLELRRFILEHGEVGRMRLAYFGMADPKLADFPFDVIKTQPAATNGQKQLEIEPGWYAISVNHLFGYRYIDGDEPEFARFRKLKPVAMAGYSIYIFHVVGDSN